MDIRNQFPSKYLRSAQVAGAPGGTVRVRILRVAVEGMRARGGAQETKPVIFFERARKGLVCNRTNGELLGKAFGWDTDGWIGHTVELYVAEVEAFGEMVDAIRVRIPKAPPPEPKAAPAAKHAEKTVDEAPERDLFPDAEEDAPEPGEADGEGNPF